MDPNDIFAENPKEIGVYNPTKEDFQVRYDINNDRKPVTFTVRAGEIRYFPYHLGVHVKKHLIDFVMNTRDLNPLIEKNWKDVTEEVTV